MKKLIFILLILTWSIPAIAADWYDTAWPYRKLVECSNPVSDYVMSDTVITLYADDDTKTGAGEVDLLGFCQSDFVDVIVTEDDGTTLARYEEGDYVLATSLELILFGDGDKYIYWGNDSYTHAPSDFNSHYGIGVSIQSLAQPNGFYSSVENKMYLVWMDAGYAPWMTYYDTSSNEWGDSYKISIANDSDLHAAPSMWYEDNRLHSAWGAHNSEVYYTHTVDSDVPISGDITNYDLTTFTEVDPNSHITVAENLITASNIARNEDVYVYKDLGAGYVDGNFAFNFTASASAMDVNSDAYVFMLANSIDDAGTLRNASNDCLAVWLNRGAAYNLYLAENNNSSLTYDETTFASGTTYYFSVARDEGTGTYGTLYLYVYNNSARTNLIDSLSIELTEKQDFRYLYVINTYNAGAASNCNALVSDVAELNWWPLQDISGGAGTYPRFFTRDDDGTDKMGILLREGGTLSTWDIRTTIDNGATWSTAESILTYATGYAKPYITDFVVDDNGNMYIAFEYLNDASTYRYNQYIAKYDEETDEQWESMDGTALSTPITKSEADSYCKILTDTSALNTFHWGRIALDSSDNPAVLYQEYGGASNPDLYFTRWTGSAWTAAVKVIDTMAVNFTSPPFYWVSGSGATASYEFYTNGGETDPISNPQKYTSSDGGATWSNTDWTTDVVGLVGNIENWNIDYGKFFYTAVPSMDLAFPYTFKVYPTPEGTTYNTGFLNTYADKFNRDLPSVSIPELSPYYPYALYRQYPNPDGTPQCATISDNTLKFAGESTGTQDRLWTAMSFNTNGWAGYKFHFELPDIDSSNTYTKATFGTCGDDDWYDSDYNIPNDGIFITVEAGGSLCDVAVVLGGSVVINDQDNAMSGTDVDIYLIKGSGGDQLTVKCNSGATTLYTGTIPSSGQLPDELWIMMGEYASGGTSSAVYYDNVSFSPYDTPVPVWSIAGALERIGNTSKYLLTYF